MDKNRKSTEERVKKLNKIEPKAKAEVYTRYPISSVLIYNGTTILHYLFGGIGITLGYNIPWIG